MKKILLSMVVSGVLLNGWANDRALITDDYSNYFSTAKEIPLNMQISGSIETAGDIDIFKFTLDKDDGVYFISSTDGDIYANFYLIKKETIETLSEYLNEENWDIRTDVKKNIKNVLESTYVYQETKKTLNMDKGDYYVVVMAYYDTSTTPYTFHIESTENNGSVTLDKVTLEYCKNNPSECGLSVNSELKYTQSDLDSAKEEGKTEAKNELKLSKEKIETLGSGWNMVGTGEAISTSELNGEIWSYENGSWSHNPNELKAFSGFWIKK